MTSRPRTRIPSRPNGIADICRPQRLEDLVGQDKLRYDSDIKAINILPLGFPVDIYTLINHYQTKKEIWERVEELIKVVQQPATFQPDIKFVAPTFLPTDDLIASLNKAMIFLSSAYNSRYPPTNTQPRTSSNPKTQATIQNAKLRFIMFKVDSLKVMRATIERIKLQEQGGCPPPNHHHGGGQTTVQPPQPHLVVLGCDGATPWDVSGGQPPKTTTMVAAEPTSPLLQSYAPTDCDDEATTNAIFMANLSPVGSLNDDTVEPLYDSDILYEVPHYDTYYDYDMLNSNIQELGYIENIVSNNESYDELTSNNNVISYIDYMLTIRNDEDNYVPPPVQKNYIMLYVIKQMKSQVDICKTVNQEKQSMNESLTSELERYKDRVRVLEYAVKDGHSEQETHLSRELYTAISVRYRKVSEYENQVFSQQTEMKNLNNHIAFLKKNFETLKKESSEKYEKNISEIVDLEKEKKELENIVFKVGPSAMHMLTKPQNFYDETHKTALCYQIPLYLSQARWKQPVLYNGHVLIDKHNPISVCDSEETLILAEESRLKMLEKQTVVNTKPIDYSKLNKIYEYIVPQTQLLAEQLYWSSKPSPPENVSKPTKVFPIKLPSTSQVLKNLKMHETFSRTSMTALKGELLCLLMRLVTEMKYIFKQMDVEVDQCYVEKKSFEIEKKQLLINNDLLLEENIASDIMCTYLRSLNEVDNCGKCKSLDIVLLDLQESNNSLCELRKRFSKLEEYSISLDIAFQNHNEKMINDSRTNNNNHLVQAINNQSLEINDLKVQLQDNYTIQKIEDENVSLAFQVSSLIKKREYIKLEYKKLTVRFGKNHFVAIMGYGDLQMGNILISRVYYIEGFGHNLFSIRKFCDSDLEVAFRKHTCFVQNLEGVDLLSGSYGSNLYTILMAEMMKKYTKDEAPEFIIKFLKQAQVSLNATVRYLRTDNDTEFLNQTQRNYTKDVGITHHTYIVHTPQQNGIVERCNHTLVEAARTMIIFSKSLLFLWAEAVATACYTQNRSLIHTRYNKTSYELLRDRKSELKYLQVFGALCYPTNNFEDLGKLHRLFTIQEGVPDL
ncbi:integrase, catalytic region, zinc finger, CCHC-type containing protein [Tanacetum coccineum]|uniref:Integrase, catalytic region, zinc finger, CCHC-type containing protein n=1 Tax=Tanacetum coccineum TaxID=301880 RepID=A0ABQ4X392_9ASTR